MQKTRLWSWEVALESVLEELSFKAVDEEETRDTPGLVVSWLRCWGPHLALERTH